jgi:hypothetical protein
LAVKHESDHCDINTVVFDTGQTLLICSCCGETWTGSVTPLKVANEETKTSLRITLRSHPGVKELVDVDQLTNLLDQ